MGLSMNKEILLVAVLVGIVLFFATYRLAESPPVWYDEGFYNLQRIWLRMAAWDCSLRRIP